MYAVIHQENQNLSKVYTLFDLANSYRKYGTQLADLHVTKWRFFFLADSRRNKGFQRVKSSYFCAGQQKKKKEPLFWDM